MLQKLPKLPKFPKFLLVCLAASLIAAGKPPRPTPTPIPYPLPEPMFQTNAYPAPLDPMPPTMIYYATVAFGTDYYEYRWMLPSTGYQQLTGTAIIEHQGQSDFYNLVYHHDGSCAGYSCAFYRHYITAPLQEGHAMVVWDASVGGSTPVNVPYYYSGRLILTFVPLIKLFVH